jgi:hypothetical protein
MMDTHNLGRLSRVDPKSVWTHEAYEFTPWLAQNLVLLNEALALDIELSGTEIAVGNFAVDIFGTETSTGHEVIIENQLAPTDHSHLGQLLTYAAGLDAKIIVWISPQIRDEHRQAVDWLNRQTPNTVSFFAVELELLKIDDSAPAPRFQVVAEPSEFQREVASEALQRRTPRQMAYHTFFSSLVNRLNELQSGFTNVKSIGYENWISLGAGATYFGLHVAIARPDILRVEIYISTGDAAKNRRALEQLKNDRTQIEAEIGHELNWEQLAKDCRISLAFDSPMDPSNPPEGALEWAAKTAIVFRQSFAPRIKAVRFDADGE